jgi:hypothetical protein
MNKKGLIVLIFVTLCSFVLIRFCFGEEALMPQSNSQIQPIEYFEKAVIVEKQVNINADVNVNGDLKCKTVKSKTTDLLIIFNVILGIMVFGLLI